MHSDPDSEVAGVPAAEEPPATDAQLQRIGRHLGLTYAEAEALLDVLAEAQIPPGASGGAEAPDRPRPRVRRLLRAALRSFPPGALAGLRAVPGLFLRTDGVTWARLERARRRVLGILPARQRLLRLLRTVEAAAVEEARLMERAARALARSRGRLH